MGKSKLYRTKTFASGGNKVTIYGNNIGDWHVTFTKPDGETEHKRSPYFTEILETVSKYADTVGAEFQLTSKITRYYKKMAIYEASCLWYSEEEVLNHKHYTHAEKIDLLGTINNRRKRVMGVFNVSESDIIQDMSIVRKEYLGG